MKYYCVFCAISCYSFNIIYSIDSLEKKKKKKRKTPYISEKNKQTKKRSKDNVSAPSSGAKRRIKWLYSGCKDKKQKSRIVLKYIYDLFSTCTGL